MNGKGRAVNTVILIEVLVLIAVLVMSVVSSFAQGSSEEETQAVSAEEESESETASEEESESESEEAVSEIYEEERLTFSDEVEEYLSQLSQEQLVAQLFVTTPEELTGYDQVEVAGDATQAALEEYPVAGLVYSELNFSGKSQTMNLLSGTEEYSQEAVGLGLFFIVEESGGENASPLASSNAYTVVSSPLVLASEADESALEEAVSTRAEYLSAEGFNMLLGPVADLADGSDEDFDELCYGSELNLAAQYIETEISIMLESQINCILRSFPGVKTAAEDYSVFDSAIEAGVGVIQAGSIVCAELTGSSTEPCTLSAETVRALRDDLGFDGIIMTSDLSDEAVSSLYGIGEAAVKALQSGMNLIYVTDGFEEAYEAVLTAVESGEITQEMLQNSVGRIITLKLS